VSPRIAAWLAAAALVLVPVGAPAAASGWGNKPKPVKAPKDGGQYDGNHNLVIYISGKSISAVFFDFRCDGTIGRTGLNDIKLEKTKKGYRFGIKAHGSITFRDGTPDENGAVDVSGRFGRRAKTVSGHFRVNSPHCGDTGAISFNGSLAH